MLLRVLRTHEGIPLKKGGGSVTADERTGHLILPPMTSRITSDHEGLALKKLLIFSDLSLRGKIKLFPFGRAESLDAEPVSYGGLVARRGLRDARGNKEEGDLFHFE